MNSSSFSLPDCFIFFLITNSSSFFVIITKNDEEFVIKKKIKQSGREKLDEFIKALSEPVVPPDVLQIPVKDIY